MQKSTGTSAFRRFLAYLLAAVLLLTGGFVPFGAKASAAKETPADGATTPAYESLVAQTKGLVNDDEVVPLVIELSDDADDYETVTSAALSTPEELRGDEARQEQAVMAAATQDEVLAAMRDKGIDFTPEYRLDLLMNGFTGNAKLSEAKKIALLPQVKTVQVAAQFDAPTVETGEALMRNSGNDVNVNEAYYRGYEGRGMVVAVLDTGADPEHQDMVLEGEDAEGMAWTREEITPLTQPGAEIGHGTWFSNKIPYGYNYYSKNNKIKEDDPHSHGMHVSGTVLANGDPDKGGIRGIAPKAQLLMMRVFREGSGTSETYYIPALEDAIKLRADAANMSLGSTAGNARVNRALFNQVVSRAREIGCVVNISAGNSAYFGNGASTPSADDPDYGVVGSPSVEAGSLSVASVNNTKVTMKPLELLGLPEGDEHRMIAYNEGSVVPLDGVFDKPLEFVYCGLAKEDQIPDSVKGKAALIERGELTFVDKINNVAKKGATLAIIYNSEAGGDDFVNMAVDGTTIPSLSVKRSDGLFMKDKYKGTEGAPATFAVRSKEITTAYGAGGVMSDFTSWGLGSNGDLKPEITAPGGNIFSTLNDNKYGNMSGTSMAAPHVSGGTALVSAYVDKTFPTVTGTAKAILVKNLLMSTALPHVDRTEDHPVYTSPRRQGAGVMNLGRATSSSVVAVGADEGFGKGYSKVVLGDVSDTLTFKVTLLNYAPEAKSFTSRYDLTTDQVENGLMTLHPRYLKGEEAGSVTVPGAVDGVPGSADVTFTIDASEFAKELSEQMPNGYFLEGFVSFASADEAQPDISIPFVGFRGSWLDAPILEKLIYDYADLEKAHPIYWDPSLGKKNVDFSSFYTRLGREEVILGETTVGDGPRTFDKTKIAFSPNGDSRAESVAFRGVFTRNFKNFSIEVVKDGTVYATFPSDLSGTKNFFDNDKKNKKSTTSYWSMSWDGTHGGTTVPDGKYEMKLTGRIATAPADSAKQEIGTYPLIVDTIAPKATKVSYEPETGVLTLAVEDGEIGSGVRSVVVKHNETVIEKSDDGTYKLPAKTPASEITVTAEDWAFNSLKDSVDKLAEKVGQKMAPIYVVAKTDDGSSVSSLRYTVVRVNDGAEEPVALAPEYPLGTYKVKVSSVPYGYTMTEKEKTVELTKAGEAVTVTFELSKEKEDDKASVEVLIKKPEGYTADRTVVAKNTATNEETVLTQGAYFENLFSGKLAAGTYEFYLKNPAEGWSTLPDKVTETLEGGQSYECELKLVKTAEFGSITVDAKTSDSSAAPVVAYTFENKDLSMTFEDGTHLPYGSYTVSPKEVPEGYLVDPASADVVLNADNAAPTVQFTYTKLSDANTGSISTELVKKNAENPDQNVTFTVTNEAGEAVTELNKVPFGTYTVTASQPFGYLVYDNASEASAEAPTSVSVTIGADNKAAVAKFTVARISELELGNKTLSLYIGKYGYPAGIDLELINADGKVTPYRLTDYSGNATLPADDYIVRPVNLYAGYYTEPAEKTVRLLADASVSFDFKSGGFVVTFDAQNGEAQTLVTVQADTAVEEPTAPTRVGYTFTGWYTDAECTTKYDFSAVVTHDMVLYAGWEATPLNVTFNPQNGQDPTVVALHYGDLVAKPTPDPVRDHFNFKGWTTDEAGTTPFDFEHAKLAENLTLYAQWSQKDLFLVNFDRLDGTKPFFYFAEDGSLITPPVTDREGYRLVGWYDDKDLTKEHDFSQPVTGELTLYAKWEALTFTVTVETGIAAPTEQTVAYGDLVQLPEVPEREGFTFTGWFLDLGLTEPFNAETPVKSNLVIYAGWEKKEEPKRGLVMESDGLHYYDPNNGAEYKNLWKVLGNTTYYFGADGVAVKGLQTISGGKYYFDTNTAAQYKDLWKVLDEGTYYFNKYGVAVKGLQEISGVLYYFDPVSGLQFKGGWKTVGRKTYYFNKYGVAAKGLTKLDGRLHYFDPKTGVQYKELWKVIGNKSYYFNKYGVAYTGLRRIGGVTYGFAPDGVQYKNTTAVINGKAYTFNKYGVLVK